MAGELGYFRIPLRDMKRGVAFLWRSVRLGRSVPMPYCARCVTSSGVSLRS